MTTGDLDLRSAASLRHELELLERERASIGLTDLAGNSHYVADLLDEIATTRNAYVGAAVTEIASLRAALDGPVVG